MVIKVGTEQQILDAVKISIGHNTQANIHYYQKLSDESRSIGQTSDAIKYKLIEKVYQGICK